MKLTCYFYKDKMLLTELKLKNRYTFHYKNRDTYFRANFLGIFSNNSVTYIILNKGQEKNKQLSNVEMLYVDMRLISNIETLLDIVDLKSLIPEDMLNEINEYW
jgi:hypothetical protein